MKGFIFFKSLDFVLKSLQPNSNVLSLVAGASDFENLSLALPMSIAEGSSILKLEELTEQPHQVEQIYGHSEDFKVHEALWQCQSLFNEV